MHNGRLPPLPGPSLTLADARQLLLFRVVQCSRARDVRRVRRVKEEAGLAHRVLLLR